MPTVLSASSHDFQRWCERCCTLECAESRTEMRTPGAPQAATVRDGGLELFPEAGSAANIGIMLFRATTADFAKVFTQLILRDLAAAAFALSCR